MGSYQKAQNLASPEFCPGTPLLRPDYFGKIVGRHLEVGYRRNTSIFLISYWIISLKNGRIPPITSRWRPTVLPSVDSNATHETI